jgi:hypothetical protein
MILRYAGRRLNDQKDDVPVEATALPRGGLICVFSGNQRLGVSSMFPVTSVVRSWFIRVIREKSAAAFAPRPKASPIPVQSSVTQEENHALRTSIIAL